MTEPAASPFAVRGVIEGFYGNPWTRQQRLDLVEFIAARGMNTFVYGPKDDPLVRRAWRAPYQGDDLARLAELVERCRRLGVDFVYCVSPGLSMRYSDPSDLDALVAKLASVGELGVRIFGLLLDDIPSELQHAADREAFTDLPEAHVSLVGRRFDRLPASTQLIVCPTVYWGYGDEMYVKRLGRASTRGSSSSGPATRSAPPRLTSRTPRPSPEPPGARQSTGTTTRSTTSR